MTSADTDVAVLFDNDPTTLVVERKHLPTLAAVKQFAAVLQDNATVKTLHVDHVPFVWASLKHLFDALANNSTLVELEIFFCVEAHELGDDNLDVFDGLARNTTLRSLAFRHIESFGAVGAKLLTRALVRRNCVLTSLELHDLNIGGVGARFVAGLIDNDAVQLQHLFLRTDPIGDVGVGHICDALERSTVLERLKLDFCGINQEAVDRLSNVLKSSTLTHLSLENARFERCDDLAHSLRHNSCLTRLELGYAQTDFSPLVDALKENRTLTTVTFGRVNKKDESAFRSNVVNMLANFNTTLVEVDIEPKTIVIADIFQFTRRNKMLQMIEDAAPLSGSKRTTTTSD